MTMMKCRLIAILLSFLPLGIFAQSVTITQSFAEITNTTVLESFGDQFRKWEKPDLDDTFPYVVIRVGLDGSQHDITMAKQMLGLYMGTQTAVEAIDRSRDDELLFLVPKRARHIEISCGEGCARATIMDGSKALKSNRIYYGRIHYVPLADMSSLARSRQKFQFSLTPSNAVVEVYVDGKRELWPTQDGTASKMLQQGNYRYRVSADRYYAEEGNFMVLPHSNELQITLRPKFGWTSVDGDTQIYGAYVFATNQTTGVITQLGTIPINKAELSVGRYTINVLLDKYKEYTNTITIREAEDTKLRPIMQPNYSQVTLTAAEMADIYIDGQRVGKGVWTGTLEYGDYMVETRQQSYSPAFTPISIASGDANVAYTLNNPTPMHGVLIVHGDPLDAAIWIDNVQRGSTPMVFNQVLVGEHRLRVEKDGFWPYEQVISIEEGKDREVNYTLLNKEELSLLNMSAPIENAKDAHIFHVQDLTFSMIKVNGGTFMMGATEEQRDGMNDNEIPIHQVSVSDFYIGQTEVTQALWKAVMGTNPSAFPSNLSNPVENVSWEDCQVFIRKLNQLTGQSFRLPTEAEWEYAARGGRDTVSYRYAGDNVSFNVAWSEENSNASTHIVAAKQPNQLGLYDMSGNVCEWCQDWYAGYQMVKQKDPQGPADGSYKVYRGGGWYFGERYARVAQRNYHTSTFSNYNIGLRLALTQVVDKQLIDEQVVDTEPVAPIVPESATVVDVEGVSFAMITVEGGTFMMGATEEQGNDAMGGERPVRKITLTDYSISQTEVTQALWTAVMDANPSSDTTHILNPVTNVSWEDCQVFVAKLNELTGRHFRLPTEAEWEYAARGGQMSKQHKYAGSANINDVAWHHGNSNNLIHPIGQKLPNELGLYDMSGNVGEWCHDWFGTYEGNNLTNPQGPTNGSYRVVRGGSAQTPSRNNRVAYRNGYAMADKHADLGFRLVEENLEMSAEPVKKFEIPKNQSKLRFEVKGVPFTMVKVESGSFVMGATEEHAEFAYDWEKPMHYVTVGDYFIGQTEVTQELWKAVMGTMPSNFQNDLSNPVENISWEECQLFIKKLNDLTGATFRLPTEAEWEYAARGGKDTKKLIYPGSATPEEHIWYKGNSLGASHPVGLKKPNELGLYDMGGNVWEWCQDWYGKYDSKSQINPQGPSESSANRRVIRGGSWAYEDNNCRVTVRNGQVLTNKKIDIGFRLAL